MGGTSYITGIASNSTVIIGIITATSDCHVSFNHSVSGDALIEYYKECNISGGTSINIYNHELSVVGTPDTSFVISPSISVAGSVYKTIFIAGGGTNKSTGATSPFSPETIFPSNSKFYVKYTNLDGNDSRYNFITDFYEV